MRPDGAYAFEITLHARPATARPGGTHADAWGRWPILEVPQESLAEPLAVGFDAALEALTALGRLYAEPDGSFVWTSQREGPWWQVDGNAFEKAGRVLLVDLKGSCPAADFDRLLGAFGWPGQNLIMQLTRAAVFFDEETFRRHARARGIAGDGETLRPA
jgi:hypothetical protein